MDERLELVCWSGHAPIGCSWFSVGVFQAGSVKIGTAASCNLPLQIQQNILEERRQMSYIMHIRQGTPVKWACLSSKFYVCTDWLTEWLTNWRMDWLTDWLYWWKEQHLLHHYLSFKRYFCQCNCCNCRCWNYCNAKPILLSIDSEDSDWTK